MLNKNTYFQTVPLVAREFIVAPFPYSLIPRDFINIYYPKNKGIKEEVAGVMPATKGVLENRGFFDIQYNSLNLPRLIQIYNPSAEVKNEYTYSAAGAKLRVVQRVNPYYFTVPVTGSDVNTSLMIQNDTTDYIGNMIYENGALKEILTPEGYWQNGVYYYDLKDHLGNNRVVIDGAGTIVEKSHYYPSGMRFQESTSNSAALPYRYGGKELEAVNGLNQYDFEARRRFACIPVTTTMDPLCEKYYPISPYAWCANNPMKYVDLRGDSITFVADNKDFVRQTTSLINEGVGSKVSKTDKNGVLSIKNLSDKQLSKLTPEQQAFYSTMKDAATSNGMATIGIVSGSEDIFVGSYSLGQIDIADVNAFGTGEGGNKFSAFGHEVVEQYQKQVNNKSYYSAHTIYALSAEDKISGYTRGTENQSGITSDNNGRLSGTLIVPFTNAQNRILLNIDINKNNIINVVRK